LEVPIAVPSPVGRERVTVTTSTERVNHLIEAARQLERGQGLFLFTDLASMTEHDDILTLPWLTGKSEPVTLI